MTDRAYEDEIEAFIRATFEENYEMLHLESGQALAANVKETALNQVLLYWRKLRAIAEAVTDTEVHLSLPNQETRRGREYTIYSNQQLDYCLQIIKFELASSGVPAEMIEAKAEEKLEERGLSSMDRLVARMTSEEKEEMQNRYRNGGMWRSTTAR